MKKNKYLIGLVALLLIGVSACRPELTGELGPDYDPTAGFSGNWRLTKVDMVDLQESLLETRDITPFYESDFGSISLVGSEGTYEVTNQGAGDFFIGESGNFSFDDPDFPSNIIFISNVGDTINAGLSKLVREIDSEMGFNVGRTKCDVPNVQYNFTFIRE